MNGDVGFLDAAHALLGIHLSTEQIEAFHRYARELAIWGKRFNLTAITDPSNVEVKHFLDSLSCLLVMGTPPGGRVVDVGTGAGFPGMPLKIVYPQLRMTLIESIGKKVEFCQHVAETLGLEGIELIHGRVEAIAHMESHRQAYDWSLARAVASMPVLVEYLLPLLRIGGRTIIQKGETGPAEVQASDEALRILGGRFVQIIHVELPRVAESRYLIVVEKVSATPPKYPRRAGIPAKRPLK